jgi:hypothetical protein
MTWLVLVMAVQLGFYPQGGVVMYEPLSIIDASGMFYQQMEAKAVLFGLVEFGGSVKVNDWIERGSVNFWPEGLASEFFVHVLIGPITVGWRHECIHPVMPYLPVSKASALWDSWTDDVFVRAQIRF